MKKLLDYISESLTRSYDHDKLINQLKKKYKDKIKEINILNSKSKVKAFSFSFSMNDREEIAYDEGLYKLLNFFGYYISEFKTIDKENIDILSIEPIFASKCTDFVKNECDGILYHCTNKSIYKNSISERGLIPHEGHNYRQFSERTFLFCGRNRQEIIDKAKKIVDQLNKYDYTILEIDASKYNVDYYQDPYQNESDNNFIYANAMFHPSRIKEIGTIEDLEKHLPKIDESATIMFPNGKKIFCKII